MTLNGPSLAAEQDVLAEADADDSDTDVADIDVGFVILAPWTADLWGARMGGGR